MLLGAIKSTVGVLNSGTAEKFEEKYSFFTDGFEESNSFSQPHKLHIAIGLFALEYVISYLEFM
jgi:hypothetical protein